MIVKENFLILKEAVLSFFHFFLLNKIVVLSISSQIASMITKAVINSIKAKKISFRNMANYGGMPSSHTVFIFSAVLGIGLDDKFGWSHPLFGFSLVVASIVLIDAIRLRGNIDKLNLILQKNVTNENFDFPKLMAHTPAEVIGGIIFSIIYTSLFFIFFNHFF